jgi:two-component sensor histidine kinase
VTTLSEALSFTAGLNDSAIEWLHYVVGDWQLIADLSFSDLVLWAPSTDGAWRAVAHVRPNTGPMVFYEDIVGLSSTPSHQRMLDEAFTSRSIVLGKDPVRREELAVREEAVPVVREGEALAVITRHTNVASARTPSRLELTYRRLADALTRMIAAGEFPSPAYPTGLRRGAPRVGDGVIHLDAEGLVKYASPNAISAIHRLGHRGDVVGEVLAQVVADLLQRSTIPVDESLALVLTGRAPWRSEAETRSASVSMRAIPLTEDGVRVGAMLIVRDVSELRRREQELMTKDATIREIHHRVKNNLQTVAALLRLQARRQPEAGARAALEEAVRRVATIALVHETLGQGFDETVNFDEVAVQGLRAVVEVATSEFRVESSLHGSFGRLRADDATSLALVVSELVQNAVEHGLADRDGHVDVTVSREWVSAGHEELVVTITDDGVGLPAGFRPGLAGLGTRIVTSFVQDLGGRIRWEGAPGGGTRVEFVARLRPMAR